ncbi:MAG TPA: class I SAM-dependent methyltransferase [Ginsengibacter sp.]
MKTSTTRFSNRVEDYVKYRPHYPEQIIEILSHKIGLNQNSIIADIGSGTGISTSLFLHNGNKVFALEPNKEMREAAELAYLKDSNFISVNGTAEKSNLKDVSIDIIFSAQAFHWFNVSETKNEFKRILKPHGHIVLVWNVRKENDEFQTGYELILKSLPEYNKVTHRNISDKEIVDFFAPKTFEKTSLSNFQEFNLDGLKGRLKSSSYCPKEGARYQRLMSEIDRLFYQFEKEGMIRFEYETIIYCC